MTVNVVAPCTKLFEEFDTALVDSLNYIYQVGYKYPLVTDEGDRTCGYNRGHVVAITADKFTECRQEDRTY